MIKTITISAVILGLVGCSSSPPQVPVSGSSGTESVDTLAGAETTSGDDGSIVQEFEAPPVAQASDVAPREEMVCRRERLTGSHRLERICRVRSDIDRVRKETQDAIRKMSLSTQQSSASN